MRTISFGIIITAVNLLLTITIGFSQENKGDLNQLNTKLEKIVVPKIEFVDTPFLDAVSFLRQRATELDKPSQSEIKGINIIPVGSFSADLRLTLKLQEVPMGDILEVVADLVDAKIEKKPHAVLIVKQKRGHPIEVADDAGELKKRIQQMIIPSVEFVDTPLTDTLAFLNQRSMEIDPPAAPINLVLKPAKPQAMPQLTFSASNMPLLELLDVIAQTSGHQIEIRKHLVLFKPMESNGRKIIQTPQPRAARK